MSGIDLGTGEEWLLDDEGEPTIRKEFRAILPEEPRLRHTYIMAGTGSGKSELLKLLIHHEMAAHRGVVVIDAHSDLCEQIARWPEFSNSGRVVYVSPTLVDDRIPIINPFELPRGISERFKGIVAERLAATIGEICSGKGSDDLSVRMETVAVAAVRVLLELDAPTFIDLRRLLQEETPEDLLAIGCNHYKEEVRDIFRHEWNSAEYRSSKSAMRQRLRRLLLQSDFRDMTCGRSTVPLYELAESGHTILFSLGTAGKETARALGKLIVCMMTIVGSRRHTTPENARRPVHVFVDECQNFMGASTVTVLEELRKYKVFLTLANQNIERLPNDVQTGILSNAGVTMMGDGEMVPSMLRKLRTKLDTAQTLEPRKFLVRWGSKPTFMLSVRSDLATRQDGLTGTDWLMVKARQRRTYYVAPVVDAAAVAAVENDKAWQDVEEFTRDLD